MDWPEPKTFLRQLKIVSGYQPQQLLRTDVPLLTEKLLDWYPDISVGSESRHTHPDFYLNECYLEGESPDKDYFPVVIKFGSEIVAFINYQKNSDSRLLTSPMGAVSPSHRKSGVATFGWATIEELGLQIGAELLYMCVTLKIPHQQLLAEKHGFKLVGIVPGNDRDMVSANQVKRVFEAIYIKLLYKPDLIQKPNPSALTPTTQKLWNFLFSDNI